MQTMDNTLFLAPASKSGSAHDHLKKAVIEGLPRIIGGQDIGQADDDIIRIWGLTSGLESPWREAEPGDWLLFYTGNGKYKYAAQISGKSHDPKIGEFIRDEALDVTPDEVRDGKVWDFLLYLDAPIRIHLSGKLLSEWLGYDRAYQSRFIRVPKDRMSVIEDRFGTISALVEEYNNECC